jgi:hypothetical protein
MDFSPLLIILDDSGGIFSGLPTLSVAARKRLTDFQQLAIVFRRRENFEVP